MTIAGNLVDEPRMRVTKNGHSVTNFRVASTSRRFDAEAGHWVDNSTLFVTVTCWRALAENANASLRKGQPVVVHGRYYMREYTVEETTRTTYELEASSVGHDLSRGVAEFRKVSRPPMSAQVQLDRDGLPSDLSDAYLDLADPVELADADAAAAAAGVERELAPTG